MSPSPEQLRAIIGRYGSLDAAIAEAKRRPGYSEELRRIAAIQFLERDDDSSTSYYMDVVVAALADEPKGEPNKTTKDATHRAPARLPLPLVERAVQLHISEGFGRRKLAASEELPGLTPYQAGQILAWYRVGRPAGLWLDEHGRLKWGQAISTTRDGMRLPRV
jgi:hypothetical protein